MVTLGDCIISPNKPNSSGYPVVSIGNKSYYHHRLIAKATYGEVVLHKCDNKLCINPDHLVLGTSADNSADMVSKNRQAKDEQCGNAKLTEELVRVIRACKGQLSSRRTADIWGTSKTNVLDIWNRKTWRHI